MLIKERGISVPVMKKQEGKDKKAAAVNEDMYSKDRVRHAVLHSRMQGYAAEGRVDALGSASRRK